MVSGVVLGPGNSSPHHKYVFVKLLTQQTISLSVEPKTRVSEARGLVTSSLHTLGMQDSAIFGLAVKLEDEYVFAEPDIKVSKYAPKAWKTSSNGVDADGEPLLQFSLRVQFYVETHLLLTDEVSQLHYYLQLRENVLTYAQPLSEETLFLLAAYALQADLGDLDESQYHGGQYFQPELYLPQWVLERAGVSYAVEQVSALHREHLGLGTSEAHAHYIREASQQEAPHNLHLYRLRHKKHDPVPQVTLAISSKGIDVFEEDTNVGHQPGRPANRAIMAAFQWTNIRQLCFDDENVVAFHSDPVAVATGCKQTAAILDRGILEISASLLSAKHRERVHCRGEENVLIQDSRAFFRDFLDNFLKTHS
ncbi:FERM domain-containing protein 6-like [Oratosquilla oratoria]|uniref:FERM domain-containing protein 6-like n=1 Tax=Oratosquilla oratoria TaxID=337810 RepID=UPI003F775ECC